MPIFADKKVITVIESYYGGGSFELFEMHMIGNDQFQIGDSLHVESILLRHGENEDESVIGYIINSKIAYFTDCIDLSDEVIARVTRIPVLILGCNTIESDSRRKHMNLTDAVSVHNLIAPTKTYLTHLSYNVDFRRLTKLLRSEKNILPAYDGLSISV